MNEIVNSLDILAIGLDSFSIEGIKKSLKENGVNYQVSFLHDVYELENLQRKNIDAVFFFSNRQVNKTLQEIRKISLIVPLAAIILISSRIDYSLIVGGFRNGIFDFLTLPIQENELRTIIYRLKMYNAIQSGKWSPERAVLHLFSRPESFSVLEDISAGLNQYLNLFFQMEKHIFYTSEVEMMNDIEFHFRLKSQQRKRISRFLNDPLGLIFGLKFFQGKFHFLIKTSEGKYSYLIGKNVSDFSINEILSDYLSNVLKTSLGILGESKKSDKIRLLSLTDEVTGLYNQRKLIEDIDFHIARYPMEKQPFSLLFIDIDYFKRVNDQYGHVTGSQLLNDLAHVLKNQIRGSDLVYRYGGDEFIVLLPRSIVEESKRIALRISDAVKNTDFIVEGDQKYKLSLSIGIAEFPTDAKSAKSIIEFADKMMYMSKKSGRGMVFHIREVES